MKRNPRVAQTGFGSRQVFGVSGPTLYDCAFIYNFERLQGGTLKDLIQYVMQLLCNVLYQYHIVQPPRDREARPTVLVALEQEAQAAGLAQDFSFP